MEVTPASLDTNSKLPKIPLEQMSKDDLVKQVKRQLILLQKTKNKCDELNKKCAALEKEKNESLEVAPSQSNIGLLKEEIIELKNKLDIVTTEKDEAISAYTSSQVSQEESLKQLQQYEKLLEESNSEKVLLNNSLHEAKQKSKELQKKCQIAEEQLDCMQMKVDTLTATCQCLQEEVNKIVSENKELKNEFNIMEDARNEALQSLKLWKENTNEELRKVEELKGEVHILRIERNELLNKVNKNSEVKESLIEKLQILQDEKVDIEEKAKTYQKQVESTEKDVLFYKSQLEQHTVEKQEVDCLQKENGQLQNLLTELKQENITLLDQLERLSVEKNELNTKVETLSVEIEATHKKKEEIDNVLDTIKEENKRLKNELNNLQNKNEITLNEQLNKTLCQMETLEIEYTKLFQEKQDALDELIQVKDLQRFVEDEVKELKEENDKLKTEIKILEADLENDKLHIRKLEKELQATEEREHFCNLEYEKLKFNLEEAEKINDSLRKDVANQKQELCSFEEIMEKFSSLQLEKNSLLIQVENLNQELKILRKHSSEMNSKFCVEQECQTVALNELDEGIDINNDNTKQQEFHELFGFENNGIQVNENKECDELTLLANLQTENTTLKDNAIEHATCTNKMKEEIDKLNVIICDKQKSIEINTASCNEDDFNNLLQTDINKEKKLKDELNSCLVQTEKSDENLTNMQLLFGESGENEDAVKKEKDDIQCKEVKLLIEEKVKLLNNIKKLEEELTENGNLLFNISQEKSNFEKKLDDMSDENRILNEKIKTAFEKENLLNQTIQDKCEIVEKIHIQMDILLNQIDDLNSQLQEKENDLTSAGQKLNILYTDSEQLQNNIKQKEEELIKYATKLENLESTGYHLSDNCPLIEEYKKIQEENKNFKEIENNLQLINKELEAKIIDLQNSIIEINETKVPIQDMEMLILEKESLKKVIVEQENKILSLGETNDDLLKQLNNSREEIMTLIDITNKIEQYKLDNEILQNENTKLDNQVKSLICKLEETEKEVVSKLQEDVAEKCKEIICLKKEIFIYQSNLNENKQIIENLSNNEHLLHEDVGEKDLTSQANLKTNNDKTEELGTEHTAVETMCQNCSKQNSKLADLETLISESTSKIEHLQTQLSEQSDLLAKAQEAKINLLEEIRVLKKENDDYVGSSECDIKKLQTSLNDAEEKTKKFKAVALRTKKQVAELTDERNRLKKSMEQLIQEKEKIYSDCRQHLLNFQNMQNEYDKLEDKGEEMKLEIKQLKQDIAQAVSELTSYKEKFSDLKYENESLKKSLDTSTVEKKHLEQLKTEFDGKIILLESRYDAEIKKQDDMRLELQKTKQKVSDIEEQLKIERNQHTDTTQQLEQALKEAKQQNLLNLEMADYERTIAEINATLEEKSKDMIDLQNQLDCEKEKYFTLTEEMKHVECQHKAEESRANNLKDMLTKVKNDLTNVRNQVTQLNEKVTSQQFQIEAMMQQEETYKVQISEVLAENEKLCGIQKTMKENHLKMCRSLEMKISTLEEELNIANSETENMKQQFESYKIRVHSVLKQKKEPSPVPSLQDESKQHMEKIIEQSKEKLEELGEKLNAALTENGILKEEHDHFIRRYNRLMEEIQMKDDSWNKRANQLIIERDALQQQHKSLTKQLQQQNIMLTETFNQILKATEEKYTTQINAFQKQLEAADIEIARLQREHQKSSSSPSHPPDELSHFDISSQERQEGEGSECTDRGSVTPVDNPSLNIIPTSGYLSFEQLLQMPSESQSTISINSQQDVETLSSNLATYQKKLEHITELLNESEANNLRMTEQVRVLKEEIRRLERNKERENHAENLEYLKNVILKFLTLEGGDERTRLIPVLTTMLRLSPEEQSQLAILSTGEEPSDLQAGWGSYLHRWSGLL